MKNEKKILKMNLRFKPHIGSTYRSNVYHTNIDMAISDEYETMPEYFHKEIIELGSK